MTALIMTAQAVDGGTTSAAAINEPQPGPDQVADRTDRPAHHRSAPALSTMQMSTPTHTSADQLSTTRAPDIVER